MQVKGLERVFKFKDMELADINSEMTVQEVKDVYSNTYPELNNAKITGPVIENQKQVFTFNSVLGTKG